MAESSFSTRHSGAGVVCTGDCTIVHLFGTVKSELELVDSERGPLSVKITKDSVTTASWAAGLTVVYLDWETAKQVAQEISRYLEEQAYEAEKKRQLHLVKEMMQ